ncbi:MAG: hypothetical protein GXP47_11155, partial [Acidobacteria bacterium]|nr:hypothetical protein [Acidobacteriota bacterium]
MTEALLAAVASLLGSWLGAMGRLSLYGAILLGVALVAEGLLRHRTRTLLHALWTLVVLRLLLPAGLASPWSLAALVAPWLHGEPAAMAAGVTTAGAPLPAGAAAASFPWWELGLFLLWLAGALAVGTVLAGHWRRSRTAVAGARPAGAG